MPSPTAQQAPLPQGSNNLLHYLEGMGKAGLELPLHGAGRPLVDPRYAMAFNSLPLGLGTSLLNYPTSLPMLHGLPGLTQLDASMLPLLPLSRPSFVPQQLQQLPQHIQQQLLQPQPARPVMSFALCSMPSTNEHPVMLVSQQHSSAHAMPAPTASASMPSASRSMPMQEGTTSGASTEDTLFDSKTLKRKQANRDSARRSRLRKEAQVGEMFQDVGQLKASSSELEQQLTRLLEAANSLEAHNTLLKRGIDLLEKKKQMPEELRQEEQEHAQAIAGVSDLLNATPQASDSSATKDATTSGGKISSSNRTKGTSSCGNRGASSSGTKDASLCGAKVASSSQARSTTPFTTDNEDT